MAPTGRFNLLSEIALWDECRSKADKGDVCELSLPAGIAGFERCMDSNSEHYRMWIVTVMIVPSATENTDPLSLITQADSQRNALLWHSRMVLTPSTLGTQLSISRNMNGVDERLQYLNEPCTIEAKVLADCEMRDFAQMRKANGPYSTPVDQLATEVGTLEFDGFGPVRHPDRFGSDYVMLSADEFSGGPWAMATKQHTAVKWLGFADRIAVSLGEHKHVVRSVRTDGAGEFENMLDWDAGLLTRKWAKKKSAPHEKGGIGLMERTIGVVVPWARHMLIRCNGPNHLFVDSILYAVIVRRVKESVRNPGKSCYEVITGNVPDVSRLRIFGSRIYALVDTDMRGGKHAPTSRKGLLVGMTRHDGEYVCDCDDGRRYSVRNNIKFYELEHIYKGVPCGRISIDQSTQTEGSASIQDLFGWASGDVGDYEPFAVSESDMSSPAESNVSSRNAQTAPAAGYVSSRLRGSSNSPARRATTFANALVCTAHATLMPEVPNLLRQMQPESLVASMSGKMVEVVGPQGRYTIKHPSSVKDALDQPESADWAKLFMEHDFKLHDGPRPFLKACPRIVARATGEKIHRGQMEFKIKIHRADGTLDKLKVRWCFDGRNWHGVICDNAASSLNGGTLFAIFAGAAAQDREIVKADVPDAYTLGNWPKGPNGAPARRVFMEQMDGYETYTDGIRDVDEVMVPLWGAPPSGKLFDKELAAALVALGAKQIDVAPATWLLKQGGHDCIIGIQVDDLLLSASTGGFVLLEYIRTGLNRILRVTIKWELNPVDLLGLRLDRDRATKRLQLSMSSYIEDKVRIRAPQVCGLPVDKNVVPSPSASLLEISPLPIPENGKLTKEQKSYREEIGEISYICASLRVDIKLESHRLSCCAHSPNCPEIRPLLDAVWTYLWHTRTFGPTYGGTLCTGVPDLRTYESKRPMSMDDEAGNGEYDVIYDATFATSPVKSISSGLHMFANAVISGNANLIHPVMTSSTQSENYSSNLNIMYGKWMREYLTAILLPQDLPSRVFGDNLPNEQMSNGGTITHSRAYARKIAYNQQEVRNGNFIFNHVSDEENPSDCMGKWVSPKKRRKSTFFIFNSRNSVRDLWIVESAFSK